MSRSFPVRAALMSLVFILSSLGILSAAAQAGPGPVAEARVYLDLDNDLATGCAVTTVDGVFDGVDQVLTTSVDTGANQVTAVERAICVDPVTDLFGPPILVTPPVPPWPVGAGLGTGGTDVVETSFPQSAAGFALETVRLGFEIDLPAAGADALLTLTGGGPILLVLAPADLDPLEIPTLGEWGLVLLTLFLAGLGLLLLRRHPAALMVILVCTASSGVLWAMIIFDGDPSDWVTAPFLDPVDPVPDLQAAFAEADAASLFFRFDAAFTAAAGNTPPVADPQNLATVEDTPLPITLTGSDADGDTLTFSIVTPPVNGALGVLTQVPPTSATLTYTPNLNFNGNDSFTFQVDDGNGGTDTATVSITVMPGNDPPVANPQAAMGNEDTALPLVLTGSDLDGDTLTFSIVAPPASGALGAVTQMPPTSAMVAYTPNMDFTGNDSFTFQVDDGNGGMDTATVNITIDPLNDMPVANPQMTMTDEDMALPLVLTGADPEGDALTVTIVTPPSNGSLGPITQMSPTPQSAQVTYTPDPNFSGNDSFTFTVSDATDTSAPATVDITVNPINDPPTITPIADQTIDEDNSTAALPFIIADPDTPLGSLTVMASSSDPVLIPNGNLVIGGVAPNLTIQVTPAADAFGGPATITVSVDDGVAPVVTEIFNVTVNPINDPPTITPIADQVIDEDTMTAALPFTIADPDTAIGSLIVTASSSNPTLIPNGNLAIGGVAPNLTIQATPAAESSGGPVTITISVDDSVAPAVTETFDVTVNLVNDPPIINTDPIAYATAGCTQLRAGGAVAAAFAFVADGGAIHSALKANITDVDTPVPAGLTFSVSSAPTNGSLNLNADGTFTYVPNPGFTGVDSFDYQVTDGATPVTGTVNVTVSEMVRYVHVGSGGTLGGGATGCSDLPFNNFTDVETTSGAGDTIFVFEAGTPLDDGITLQNGQRLHGEAFGLTVTGFGNLVAAGTRPAVNHTGGNAVEVDATTADRLGIEIRGLSLEGSDNAIDVTAASTANAGVMIDDVVIPGATNEGIDLNASGSGSFAAAVANSTIAATGNAFDVRTSGAGDFELAFDSNTGLTSTNAAGATVNIEDAGGPGTLFITSFSANAVLGTAVGTGVRVLGAIFDADPTDADFDLVNAGNLGIGVVSDRVLGSGLVLGTAASRVSGNLAFGTVSLFSVGGVALAASGTGPATGGLPPTSGFQLAIAGGTADGFNGPAVALDPLTSNIQLGTISSAASPAAAVLLDTITGTFNANSGGIVTSVGPGFEIIGGSVGVNYGGSIAQSTGAPAAFVRGGHTGTVTFGTGTISATAGTGLQFDNADGTYNFNGTTTLNGGDAGIDILNGSGGGFNFGTTIGSSASITNPTGPAFNLVGGTAAVTYGGDISQANNAPTVSISGGHGTGTVRFDSGTLGATNGTGFQFNNADGIYEFEGTSTLNGGDAGIDILNGSGGTFDFATEVGATASITNPSGTAFNADGGNGAITYGGTIANNANRMVEIINRTGGSVTFQTGALADNGGTGIRVASNSGGTTSFNGNVDVNNSTTAAVTVESNTGGTTSFANLDVDNSASNQIGIFGAGNGGAHTLNTTTGTVDAGSASAIDIDNTILGLTLVSVDSNGGAASGIDLASTTGSFTVTGDGGGASNGSGGTIANKTGNGVVLNAATNVSLNFMNLDDNSDNGVSATAVNGLTMNRSNVRRNATPGVSSEAGLLFVNLTGSGLAGANPTRITNTVVFGPGEDNIRIRNSSGTLTRLSIEGSTIGNPATTNNDDGIDLEASGTATANITVDGSTFVANRGDHFNTTALSGGTIDAVFTNNMLSGGHASPLGQGITLASGASANTTYNVSGNTINGAVIQAINVNKGDLGSGTMSGTIDDNTIGTLGSPGSGSSTGNGIQVIHNGAGTHTAAVTNNRIRAWTNGPGIRVLARDGGGSGGTLNITVTGNTLAQPGAFAYSMLLQSGATAGDAHTVCANIGGAGALGNTFVDNPGAFDGTLTLFQRFATTMNLEGYAGGATSDANLTAYLQGRNAGIVTLQTGDAPYFTGGITGVGSAVCPTP